MDTKQKRKMKRGNKLPSHGERGKRVRVTHDAKDWYEVETHALIVYGLQNDRSRRVDALKNSGRTHLELVEHGRAEARRHITGDALHHT